MATGFTMPHPDYELSPITGWTREHWIAFADQQLLAVRPYFSEHKALIRLDGRPSSSGTASDGMEGFARTFLLAAFRVAGEQGQDPHGHLALYRRGLLEGTKSGSPEEWLPIRDRSQAIVEAASIALGLQLTKPWLWDGLSAAEQSQAASWLQGSSSSTCVDNNWVLFQVLIAEFLAGAGFGHNEGQIEYGLQRLEDWYVASGWYRDGDNGGTGDFFDYYCGWALHLYPVLWSELAAGRHPEADAKAELYRTRLAAFLDDHLAFFGATGAPVFQGRSLIYRYAAVAPLFLGEAICATPLNPGQTRRIASGAAKYFLENGAYDVGLPSLGWLGAFEPMTQDYSGPASPYWTSKAFVGLLLPPDHPVWTAVEELSPVETSDIVRHAEAPNYLLHATSTDGIARLLNHGSDKYYAPGPDDPQYRRLAYSSHTAPLFTDSPVDNHFAVLDAGGTPSRRARINRLKAEPGQAASWHAPVWSDEEDPADSTWRVATGTAAARGYELRVHVVEGPGSGEFTVREGGYALASDEPVRTTGEVLSTAQLHTRIWPLHGYSPPSAVGAPGSPSVLAIEGVSPLGKFAACQYLEGRMTAARASFASLVYLGGEVTAEAPAAVELYEDAALVRARVELTSGLELKVSFAL